MKINVKVIAAAKRNEIIKEENSFKVYVNKPAVDNKANLAVIELLADYFKVRKNSVNIIKGQKSKNKIIEIK